MSLQVTSPYLPPPPYTALMRGQAVLDYDGEMSEEISLMIHEVKNTQIFGDFFWWKVILQVLNIYKLDPQEEEFLLGERETQGGCEPCIHC